MTVVGYFYIRQYTHKRKGRDLCKIPFPQQPKPKYRFSAISLPQYLLILPKCPLNPPWTPHNKASAPPFRQQRTHLACWQRSTSSDTLPSDGLKYNSYCLNYSLLILGVVIVYLA